MKREEKMRRDILGAMGWTNLHWNCFDLWGMPPGGMPEGNVLRNQPAPNPLESARDAEALESWLVGQERREVETRTDFERCSVRVWTDTFNRSTTYVYATDEPDPARRRRRALVEAAWQAVTTTRKVDP